MAGTDDRRGARPTAGEPVYSWWLLANAQWGMSVKYASDPVDARGAYRDAIVDQFMDDGLSKTASRRAAQSHRVFVVAGGLSREEAFGALEDWDSDHRERWAAVEELGRRWRGSRTWSLRTGRR